MSTMNLYPMRMSYELVPKLWGGDSLARIFGFKHSEPIGEVWNITDSEPGSMVLNGSLKGQSLAMLTRELGESLLGSRGMVAMRGHFPLMLKFLHAAQPLSVQVHPPHREVQSVDHMTGNRFDWCGKSETWYILDSSPGAYIYLGFAEDMSRESVKQAIDGGTIEEVMNKIPVHEGDSFYLPAGMIHALGPGVTLVEMQSNCPVTYRLYDYHRLDPFTGRARRLDVDKALEALHYKATKDVKLQPIQYVREGIQVTLLVLCRHFCGELVSLCSHEGISICGGGKSVYIVTMLKGQGIVSAENGSKESSKSMGIVQGETVLIPAELAECIVESQASGCEMLIYHIPDIALVYNELVDAGISEKDILNIGGPSAFNDLRSYARRKIDEK